MCVYLSGPGSASFSPFSIHFMLTFNATIEWATIKSRYLHIYISRYLDNNSLLLLCTVVRVKLPIDREENSSIYLWVAGYLRWMCPVSVCVSAHQDGKLLFWANQWSQIRASQLSTTGSSRSLWSSLQIHIISKCILSPPPLSLPSHSAARGGDSMSNTFLW